MSSAPTASLEATLRALKVSPIFQLSLASKELFHSNFLAWLCETHPLLVGRLFATFLNQEPPSYDRLRVYRERNNIDVWLEFAGGEALIIENKVKSLPELRQLEEYAAAAQDRARTSFLLLSLTRPTFLAPHETAIRLRDGAVWQYLAYGDLAGRLRDLLPAIAAASSYHGQLLGDYIDVIAHLDALQAHFSIDWDDADGDFFGLQQAMQRLTSIRLHDLIDKLRYAQLAQRVADALRSDGFPVDNDGCWRGEVGKVLVGSGLTRGVGLFDFKYCLMDKGRFGKPVLLGVQVQGRDFRLVAEIADRTAAPKIAAALRQPDDGHQVWFNFGLLPGGSEEYPKKRLFNQYSGQFLYRSKRIGGIAPQRLVDTIVGYARVVRSQAAVLRQQIEAVGERS